MDAAFLVGRAAAYHERSPRQLARSRRLPRFDLRCSCCGYGVVVRVAPDRCVMCAGSAWEYLHRRDQRH
jgi:rubrerythrin